MRFTEKGHFTTYDNHTVYCSSKNRIEHGAAFIITADVAKSVAASPSNEKENTSYTPFSTYAENKCSWLEPQHPKCSNVLKTLYMFHGGTLLM